MFTGLIEEIGTVRLIEASGNGVNITINAELILSNVKNGDSISIDGACQTVTRYTKDAFTVFASKITCEATTLGSFKTGRKVNLERAMSANGRFGGHIVQGHVDQTAVCTELREAEGSWYYTFEYDPIKDDYITVEKGSISVNGVSLTVVNSKERSFEVAIIPYTYEVTNFHEIKPGTVVNIEFDIIGKYIAKILKQMKL